MKNKNKGGGGYHFINISARQAHKELVERNKKMTPEELGMDERFEDVPTSLSDRDKYGRVHRVSTSSLLHRRNGSTFDD